MDFVQNSTSVVETRVTQSCTKALNYRDTFENEHIHPTKYISRVYQLDNLWWSFPLPNYSCFYKLDHGTSVMKRFLYSSTKFWMETIYSNIYYNQSKRDTWSWCFGFEKRLVHFLNRNFNRKCYYIWVCYGWYMPQKYYWWINMHIYIAEWNWYVAVSICGVDTAVLLLVCQLIGHREIWMKYVIFKQILVIDGWDIFCQIALIWISLDFTNDQSALVQVMAWCHQATSHYRSQCWPRSLSPYGITRPKWVN